MEEAKLDQLEARSKKFQELDLEQVKKLAEYGHTDQYMAEFFNIKYNTWVDWKTKYEAFREALQAWKRVANETVARKLYEKAVGYEHVETKATYDKDLGRFETIDIIKRYPPDSVAASFWLKCRDPENWRDKQEIEVKGDLASLIINARKRNPNPEEDFLD